MSPEVPCVSPQCLVSSVLFRAAYLASLHGGLWALFLEAQKGGEGKKCPAVICTQVFPSQTATFRADK